MASKLALRILILSDGLPGHTNQSRGLVNWLASRYDIEYQLVDIKLRAKGLSRVILPWLLHHTDNTGLVTQFYHYSDVSLAQPNLIISAGGNTSFLNVVLARHLNIPNIFLGSKRRLHSDDFSAHLTLEPTEQAHNVVMKMPPSLTDTSVLTEQGTQLRNTLNCKENDKIYLLAFGGDGAGYRYDKTACKQIVQLIKTISEKEKCKWLLTTSRRTGKEIEQTLQSLLDPDLLLDAVWWSEKPRKVMNAFMGAADRLFVSIDSMSMISEAIASGKPTTLLQPNSANPDLRYQQALEKYCDAHYCSIHRLNKSILKSFTPISDPALSAREDLLNQLAPILATIDANTVKG
jgi:mitochondrial fission protein ELM1